MGTKLTKKMVRAVLGNGANVTADGARGPVLRLESGANERILHATIERAEAALAGDAVGLDAALWRRAWADALRFASRDDTRPHMCGLYLDAARGTIGATDGHRAAVLAVAGVDKLTESCTHPNDPELRLLVAQADGSPWRVSVPVRPGGNTGPKDWGPFLPLERVIPTYDTRPGSARMEIAGLTNLAITAERAPAFDGPSNITIFAGDGGTQVLVGLAVRAFWECTARVPVQSVKLADPSLAKRGAYVGVRASHLADAIAACPGGTMYIGGELDPILIAAKGVRVVVMPVRL